MFRSIVFAVVALVTCAACQRNPQAEQQKADQAQREAAQKQGQGMPGLRGSNVETTSGQVEADKKSAQAQADFAKTRDDYRHDLQMRLDDADKKIMMLEAKEKAARGKALADIKNALSDIRARRDSVSNDRAMLDSATAHDWHDVKARIDQELDGLDKAVSRAPSNP
jgi:hypothetical protein